MAQFEELQALWQQQPETPISHRDAASLATDFRRFGRRQDLINLAKLSTLVFQIVYVVLYMRHDALKMLGAALADATVVYFLAKEWRNQRAVARLDFTARSTDFVRSAIARMEALRNPFRGRPFYILMGGFWVGTNLMLPPGHWWYRLFLTAVPFLIYKPGVYLRAKRWDHECRPLVERLQALVDIPGDTRP
jgi:hypothetical protein